MARTFSDAVVGVLEGDYDSVNLPNLQPYIDTASLIVTRVAACAATKGITLSTEELEMMERWLAAHYYVSSDQVYASHSTADASATFQGQTGMSLDGSKYGQAAQNLDFSGCLTALSKRQVASGAWLGKTPSEQIPFYERD